MKDYNKIESCLKSFLKNNKRLSYSIALLITFLINGGFSYADEAVQVPLRTEIKTRIEKEQENISQMLKEADESMKGIELKIKKLIQRGEFWVKPLEKSYQGFIFANWGNYSKNKNKTESNFNGPEYSASYGSSMGYGQFSNGKYYGEYGIVKNPLEFVDKIDFGANITPKAVAEKTIVEKTVVKKDITAPVVTPPTVEVGTITLTAPEEVKVNDGDVPNDPTVNIQVPGTVPTLGGITVAAVTALNVNPTPPTVGEAPKINAPTVTPPATPAGFTPRLVSPPTVAEKIVNISPVPNPPSTDVHFQDVPNNSTGWYGGTGSSQVTGNNGLISQLDLTAGKFEMYFRGHEQGQDHKFTGASDSAGILPPTYSVDGMNKVAFYGIGGKPLVTIPNTVTIKAVGNNTTNSPLNAIFYLGNNTTNPNSESKLINRATVNLYGNKIAVSNIDNVSSSGNTTFVNEGNIIGHAESGEYASGKVGNANVGNYIFGGYSYGDAGVDTIENGTNGNVAFYAPNSVGWAYTSSNTQAVKRSSINNGTMKLYGHHSLGIATDNDASVEQMSWADIQLNTPIEILGDQSVGASIKTEPDETKSTNFFGSKWNIKIGGLNGSSQDATHGNTQANANKVEQSIGLNFDFTVHASGLAQREIKKYKVSLEEDSDSSTGIRVGTAKINLTDADTFTQIKINGTNNIGLLADGSSAELKYTNTRNALNLDGGSGNILFATINSGKLNVENKFELKTSGGNNTTGAKFVSTYTKGAGSKVTFKKGISFNHIGDETIGMYATDSGNITVTNPTTVTLPTVTAGSEIDNSTLPSVAASPTISTKLSINGNKSVGYYANNGGTIVNEGSSTKVTDGSALAYAKGANSKITISNSLLDYSGEGYSLYTENNGKIVADGSVLVLRGKAVGMKAKSVSNNDISFTNGKIVMMSNEAIPFVASDITSTVNVSDIRTGLGLPNTITIAKGKEGGTVYNKYKIAAVDGMANLTIDQNLDKKYATDDNNETSSDLSKKASYALFRRYLIQRAKVEASGKTIKAVLDSNDLAKLDTTQVVGLEMNSSKNASSVSETAINLKNGAKIIADRTDAGAGAIGAFINYGEVNIDATSKIEVEKENNVVNKQAVGVYAVNGSKVDNKGTIDVGGNQSVGILGIAYREGSSNNPIVKEFGGKSGEGTVNITNEKDIKMSGKDAIGIYAMNNNPDNTVTSHLVTNKGTVEVGDSDQKTAVGIYAKGVNVKPEGGKIKIGKKAVGIYAENSNVGETGKDLGTIDFNGDNGVGIYLKGGLSNLDGNKVTLSESGTSKNKVGMLADRETNSIIKTEVVVGTLNNVIAYYSKGNNELNVQSNLTLNEDSIGMSGEGDLLYGNNSSTHTMKLGKGSTGIFGNKNITLTDKTTIELNGNSSVGVFAKGASGIISSNGNIKFTKENSIGLYGANGATVNDKTASMDFSNANAKNNIGAYLAGAKWVDSRTGAYTFNSDHSKNNIYLFAQGGTDGTTDFGSTATLKNEFKVNPTGTASSTAKTIGMYFNTAVKGKSTFVDNTLDMADNNAKISVTNSGIGVYAKNTDNSKNNIINKIKVSSVGQGTVGVFADGNLKLDGTDGLIEAKSSGIGIYGNSGKVTVENKHKVEVTSAGTGMYLTKGSHLDGGKLELENKTAGTSAAGIYYEGTNNEVDHNTDIEVTAGENLLAIYANGLKLNNNKEIIIKKGKNNVAAYITGNSTFRNKGKIQLGHPTQNDFESGIGVYVVDGEAINESGKTIDIYDFENTASGGSLSVGMLANAASGKTAKVTNKGTINANGEVIGMVVEDNSEGINDTGAEIVAKDKEDINAKAIGAYVKGANAKFENKGKISAENIALALQGTKEGNIKNTGTLNLTKTGAVGVYAKDSVVDFNIAPTVASGIDKTVALYASGTTKIKSQITSASGKAHIGVYAEGDAEFQSGSKVTVGNGDGKDYGIGVYTKAGYNKIVNTDIKLTGEKTIGFYLGATGSTGSKVTHTGTINVGSGIGAYIPEHSKFIAQNTTFNVGNDGTAVYLKGGDVDLGAAGTANINFNGTNGRAIYQDGGNITTGAGLHINGSGSFLTLKNANSSINSVIEVGKDGIAINGIYDKSGTYKLTLESPNGHIKLGGDKATGIAAIAKNTAGLKVDIINKGTIETTSGEKTTGIYGKGANITNQAGAKINIGAKGVGIYTTNDSSLENTTLNNAGEINLEGDEAVGIVAVKAKTNQDFVVGKITGTKNKLVGAYFKESLAATKVKDFDISLGDNAKGLVFDGGSDFTVTSSSTNKVKIGDTTGSSRGIGIAALGVNGTVFNTEVKVGKNSLGLYVKNKKLTFDLASGKLESSDASRSSILAYADGNNSEVALNGGGTLKVGSNGIALGTKGGKITANAATNVEVDGVKGLGAYVENGGSISNNFDIKVKSAEGIGMYAKGGALASVAKVSEIKGNKSIGYVFENITNAINMPNSVQLTDTNATGQVGVAVKGTGAGLTVAGVSVVGSKNIGIYNETTGAVTNNGALNVADSTGDSSIGIYSQGGTVTSIGNATIGKNSVGIYGKDAGAKLSGDMTVDEKGIGLYVDNDTTKPTVNTEITGKLEVGNNGTIGIQATNSNVKLGGDLTVGDNDSKGIFSKGAGKIETGGNIAVGKDSVGIYKEGSGKVETAAGKTLTVAEKGFGIYSKGAEVDNKMDLTINENAIGIYVENNNLTSNGNVSVGDKGVGLLVKGTGKTLTSTGNITVGSNNSVGLYAGDNANIAQSGNITVANNNGIGVYSKGNGNVSTIGAITVGKDSIGVYKDGKGTMNINASSPIQTMTIAEKGYGLYYKGNSVADSTINNNMNMTLGKEAVGIYAKNTTVNHTGNITVGETTIGSSGFTTPSDNKNSIGIFGDNANINFKGNMLVDKPLSVGIYGANGGSITVQSGSTITVKNGATGIMTGSKVENITLKSGSTLNVDGKVDTNVYTNATKSNVSFGIAAYSGLIDNQGTINVTNGATGIYLAGTASLKNGPTGTINIDATSKSIAKPDTKASAELGGIKVTDKGVVTINNKVINGGTLNVKGALNMEGLGLDISTGKTVVDAKSISGVAEVLPSFSKGNSEQKVTIKDVFRTGVVGGFSGDVKSKSVSWIAKISKAPGSSTTTSDITMVRIPYNSLISGERYKNLASGLEDIRSKIGKDSSSPIFKSLDNISSHRDFARAVANIRGDVYSNIQERMKTVENSFDKSYNELLSSYNKTRNVDKFSVIYTGGEHKDSTLGVSGYEYKSTGVLYLNDREAFTYGGKYGWSAGIVGSNFEFNGDTNKGSKERVVSGKLGLHYQTPLNKEDDNARLKWLTRGEITVNNHRTKRYSQVGADTYQNKASFYSTELSWKNIISYDYDINTNWTVKPYTGIDISYGHIFNIKEKNEGLPLEVKGKDYFVITPNVGVETKYVLPLGATHQVFAKADTEFSYDVTKLYHGVNQAKMKNTSTGYYDLSKPERRRARVAVGAELGLEKENAYGITFRAEYQGYKKSQLNYGVRLNYKF